MKFRKIVAVMVVSVMMAGMLSGCIVGKNAKSNSGLLSDSQYIIKIGNTVSDVDPFNVAYRQFKEEIEEASDGKIEVKIFSSGSIGETDADVLDKVRANTLQMGNTTPNCLSDLANMPSYYVYGIPYLMASDDELNKVGESEWMRSLNEDFRKATGVKIFDGGGVNMGWFGFSLTKGEINSLEDLKGQAIRINQTNQMISLTSEVGISPQFIAFSEVYTALAQGTVDGMVTNMPLYYSNGFYDQLESILSTKCGESYHFYIMNDEFYNSLPDDLKLIVDEGVAHLIESNRKLEEEYLQETVSNMKEQGVKIKEISAEDEETMKKISKENIWWNQKIALASNEDVNHVLKTLGRTEEMK